MPASFTRLSRREEGRPRASRHGLHAKLVPVGPPNRYEEVAAHPNGDFTVFVAFPAEPADIERADYVAEVIIRSAATRSL